MFPLRGMISAISLLVMANIALAGVIPVQLDNLHECDSNPGYLQDQSAPQDYVIAVHPQMMVQHNNQGRSAVEYSKGYSNVRIQPAESPDRSYVNPHPVITRVYPDPTSYSITDETIKRHGSVSRQGELERKANKIVSASPINNTPTAVSSISSEYNYNIINSLMDYVYASWGKLKDAFAILKAQCFFCYGYLGSMNNNISNNNLSNVNINAIPKNTE